MKYIIFTGHDHKNNTPLYQVKGVDNDFIGEWCGDIQEAERELQGLQKNISIVCIHHDLEVPKIEIPTLAAVKEWFGRMQKMTVRFDMRNETAYSKNASVSDINVNPDEQFTFDQAAFIDSEIALAKNICRLAGWNFNKLYDYHPPVEGMYLEVFPMKIEGDEETLCCRGEGEPDFYAAVVYGDELENIYFERDQISPRRITAMIEAICTRFNCDFDMVD